MTVYKLTYWDIRGRAEPIRMIAAAAGIQLQDVRISKKEWPALKPLMPWGQVPVLEIDGEKVLAQSMSICRYLARKFNLTGENDWEAAKCDEYVDALSDLLGEMKKIVHAATEELKATLRANFLSETMPRYLTKFEAAVKSNKNGTFLCSKLTWSDIVLVNMLEKLETPAYGGVTLLDSFPNLKKLRNAVHNYPGIKEWIQTRPNE